MMESTQKFSSLKRLIWLYFWLIIFEGALRRWILPALNQPLALVRDPLLLWIYGAAFKAQVFPRNGFISSFVVLGLLFFGVSLLLPSFNLWVTLYGLHANFLHLPLIFLIANVFTRNDVQKIGKWLLILSVMMAVIMVLQFQTARDSFWNRGVEGDYDQLTSAFGKGRPPGTFSFSTGPALFFSLVMAYLVYGAMNKKVYHPLLLIAAGASTLIALVVSGSRTLVVEILIVFGMGLGAVLFKPLLFPRFFKFLILIAVISVSVSVLSVFKEGKEVLSERFNSAGGVKVGLVDRTLGSFQDAFDQICHTSFWGEGIGTGTSGGSFLLTGTRKDFFVENEWLRCLSEGGIILGISYILLRLALVLFLFRKSWKSLNVSNILPLLLFWICAPALLNGQLGQPNLLGFAVFSGGLCLAAAKAETTEASDDPQ